MALTGKIPCEFGNLSFLVSLDLGSNNFHGNFPHEMARLRRLKFLDLSFNNFGGAIPCCFGFLHQLQVINIRNNSFTGSIPSTFSNVSTLEILNLNLNSIEGQIQKVIGSLINLGELRLRGNKLIASIPLSLSNASRLETLDISFNSLQGNIPEGIGNLHNMKLLGIQANQLTGSIPFTIFNISRIEVIAFTCNSLSDIFPMVYAMLHGHMPTSLSNCSQLQLLGLSENEFDGPIHSEIGRFSNLQQLFLGTDHFTAIGNLRNLQRFDLSNNKLTGFVGDHICKLQHLGSLPPEIGNLMAVTKIKGKRAPQQADSLSAIARERISYYELIQATDALSESNLIGSGSFGSVYKGVLRSGTAIVVKVFNLQLDAAFKSFDTECEVLRSLRNRNLVKVITSCSNLDFKALVLEYMPNGSLEKYLYSHNYFLDIMQRLSIMIDVACALEYLHHGCSSPVIHYDLKPSNVLLDVDMVAHLSDFGTPKLLGDDESELYTKTIASLGYIAPGASLDFALNISFPFLFPPSYHVTSLNNCLILERKPSEFAEDLSLKQWVSYSLPDAVIDVADANLVPPTDNHVMKKLDCVASIIKVALDCCAESPARQTNMKDVVGMLQKIRIQLLAC
ncbi:receptor kinase-like protein Xa21 [Capsicum annuum]|uniref:receptor kinase-like protein Xa21 n=1 Tax=Capsicum annuum TaxID=4072 RepID=UPI001FB09328|nr:receptor kinase-like protein Xa21 [Capsicum annuum]